MTDRDFMLEAIALSKTAKNEGEVPVGAVIVYEGEIIAKGRNKREKEHNSLCHAEIEAINAASKVLGDWRLRGGRMYVTLEPCPMCAGAIINSRIDTVVFGAYDEKGGCLGSAVNFSEIDCNHKLRIIGGYMAEQCRAVLQEFFKGRRGFE